VEMSCQRCGGVLAAELAVATYELVCRRVVFETRYSLATTSKVWCEPINRERRKALSPGSRLEPLYISEERDTMIG
jgi:hypothetical protein